MKLSVTRQSIARCLKIILGNFLITGAYAFITVPNEIVNGGVTSFSMILGNWKEIFHRNRIQLFLLSHPVFRPARVWDMQSWFIRSSAWFWPDSLSAPDIISASVPNPLL